MNNNYRYKCFIYILVFSIFSCFDVYAGGGSAPPPDTCNAEIVSKKDGELCDYNTYSDVGVVYSCSYKCTAHSPKLPSWEEIKAQSAVDKKGISSFTLDFNRIPDSYQRINIDGFADYVSCNPADGATRYVKSGYVYRHQSITGNYCKKWVIGISKNYMRSAIQSNYKNGEPKENVDIKLFCDSVEQSSKFDHSDPLVGGSYMLHSEHYVCRDGVIQNASSGNCKVGVKYELSHGKGCGLYADTRVDFNKCLDRCYSYWNSKKTLSNGYFWVKAESYCADHKDCFLGCYNHYDLKFCYKDISTYDRNILEIKRYNTSICHKPIIKRLKNGIKLLSKNFYDPNLIYE